MHKRASYTGIDNFRLIAAFLVVAIHTAPLTTYNQTADFILTRILARVAVPFFFVTSGFFLISSYHYDNKKLEKFLKKTTVIYLLAILFYLPINIYNRYFSMEDLLPNIIKDLVFDGTLYHLWYLPASMLGAVIAWYLVKRFSYREAFLCSGLLYVIGLFGDSYYGLSLHLPALRGFYDLLFQIMDYTRNGLFFAPIFFVMGGYLAKKKTGTSAKTSLVGLCISFILMLVEGLSLHAVGLQRHDSMYVFLLPCTYFLFAFLLHFEGKRHRNLRTIALMVYLIHPFMIVVIRFLARGLHMQDLLVDNSLIHYLCVCLTSLVAALILTFFWERWERGHRQHAWTTDRAFIELHLENLEHNVRLLQDAMPQGCQFMAVVKAESYGHGLYEVAGCLQEIGVTAFAVATIDEGIRLRKYGIHGGILILGYTSVNRAEELHKYKLTQTVVDYAHALHLNKQGYALKVHIKIDTGMHRLGFAPEDYKKIKAVFGMKHLEVAGMFTHLCVADSLEQADVNFTHKQIDSFYHLVDHLEAGGQKIPKVHIQSSYGLLNYPELDCDYVRIGIAMYGVLSAPQDKTKLKLDLRPALSLKARVVLLRKIKAGESVGYGRTFLAQRDSRIAILPIGYADGYPRFLSGQGHVLLCGKRAPIIGRICMDQLAVDVTDIPEVKVGSLATLIGRDGAEEITAPEVADQSESISNELLSRMGSRLKIVS